LYVGNLPPAISSSYLTKSLNIALNIMGRGSSCPILSSTISQDGHYAFVEFATKAETDECADI
jgi:hypothetical protein